MMPNHQLQLRARQHGVVALLFLLTLTTAVLAIFVSSFSSSAVQINRDKQTAAALAQAKEALIGRSGADQNKPGSLPYPDYDNNGAVDVPGDVNTCLASLPSPCIGRLPWRTLGLPDLRDGAGERLWYALSSNFRDQTGVVINSDTAGQLNVTGITPATNVIAVVFAPATVVGTQVRNNAHANNVQNYLEGENNDSDSNYVSGATTNTFNDRLLTISQHELFSVVEKRVAKEVEAALNLYYMANNYYPLAAAFNDSTCLGTGSLTPSQCASDALAHGGRIPANPDPAWTASNADSILRGDTTGPAATTWFQRNGWRELVYYAVAPACAKPNSFCTGAGGHLSVQNAPAPPITDQKVVVVVAGRTLAGESRSNPADRLSEVNYLEGENVAPLDNVYERGAITATFNDQAFSIP